MRKSASTWLIASILLVAGIDGAQAQAKPAVGNHDFRLITTAAKEMGDSYCLRAGGRDSFNVRRLWSSDNLVNEFKVVLDEDFADPTPAVCERLAGDPPLQIKDELVVTNKNGQFWLQIKRPSNSKFFPKPAQMTDVDGFAMFASNGGYDYFVMLADDSLGFPKYANYPKIEKYYRVEAFPSTSRNMLCTIDRPDTKLMIFDPIKNDFFSKGLLNYKPWTGNRSECWKEVHETSSSGGGEHPPDLP